MAFEQSIRRYGSSLGLAFAATALLASPALYAQSQLAVPRITEVAADHGSADTLRQTTVTVHLKQPNEAAYTAAVEALYTPGSPTYHHWFTDADLAKFAPPASDFETVKRELQSHGLSIVSSDGFSVRARGSIDSIQNAFHTSIHDFTHEGKTFHANITSARLSGAAGDLVDSVSGLSNFALKPHIKYQIHPGSTQTAPTIPLAKVKAAGVLSFFTNTCFEAPTTVSFTTQGQALPVSTYSGYEYDKSGLACGYTPKQAQDHYGLQGVYKKGLQGEGQTIVIIDGPTSSGVTDDLAAFSSLTGLPPIDSTNFQIIYPDGKPTVGEFNNFGDAITESDLDVEWAHAIAPKAKIVLLILPTFDWPEFEYAINYVTAHKLGKVVSISYGYPEFLWGAAEVRGVDSAIKAAAASGIAINISSGDGGDDGAGTPHSGGASYPAASSYATSVGGTSIGVPDGSGGVAEVGWGHNASYLSFASDFALDPPIVLGFLQGGGGGESLFINKPSWQSVLPGRGRQQPDISAFADPYTGAIIVSQGQVGVVGGTSLSSPVFAGIWALANQKAGKSLGQAAPHLASLTSVINDVVPVAGTNDVTGHILDSTGNHYYSASKLLLPLAPNHHFYSALWNLGFDEYVDLSFDTDSSLTTNVGWDNVTGYGVPNGLKFVLAAAALK